jgi:hypothetical protein
MASYLAQMPTPSMYCPYCKRHTSITKAYNGEGERKEFLAAIQALDGVWWIGLCNYCRGAVLVKNLAEQIYPTPFPSPTDERIPSTMQADLNEAKKCLSVDAYRACAVMARRALQQACLDLGGTSENLAGQLDDVYTSGIITKNVKEWGDSIRWIGNDAAHPSSGPVTKTDAEEILTLAEQFLTIVYVTPKIAEEQRQKRGKNTKN